MKSCKFTAIIISFFALCGPVALSAEKNGPILSLGAIASLTGDASHNGTNWLEGAQLAIDELNRQGTAAKLIVEDDGTNPGKVATSFVKLATVDKVSAIVGGTWDFLAETAFPLAKQYRVPFITPTNPVEILSPAALSNPWVFTNGLSLAAERKVIHAFFKERGIKKIGLVYINVPYGTSHADLVREVAKEIGATIVSDDEISYQAFRDTLKLAALRISEKKPEAVFVVSNYEGVDFLLRELERMQSSPIILMTHNLKEAFDFGGSSARYKNAYAVYPKVTSAAFEESFQRKYGRLPLDYAAAGYDAVMFIAHMVKANPGLPAQAKFVYAGVTGTHVVPSESRSVVPSQAVVMHMNGSHLVELRS